MKSVLNLAIVLSIGLATSLAKAEILRRSDNFQSPLLTQVDINNEIAKDVYNYFYDRSEITPKDLAENLLTLGDLRVNLAIVRTIVRKAEASGYKFKNDKLMDLDYAFNYYAKDLGTGILGFFWKYDIVKGGRLLLSPEVSAKMSDDKVVQMLYRFQMVVLSGIVPFTGDSWALSVLPKGTVFDPVNLVFKSAK